MPLYEYQCDSCAHRFERIQKFSDPPVETCPSCGGAVKKLLSSPAIQFKGSGWYITDYAKKGKQSSSGDAQTGTTAPKDSPATDAGSTSATSAKESKDSTTPATKKE